MIEKNNVVMFTKSTCPKCVEAKQMLDNNGYSYVEYELKTQKDKDELFDIFEDRGLNPPKTVPQIFLYGKHIGGADDLKLYISDLKKNHDTLS